MVTERRMVEELLGAIATMQTPSGPNPVLTEALDNVKAMLAREDRGWELFQGGSAQPKDGLSLKDLKQWSAKLRESVAGAPWIKRGLSLRASYIWQGGMKYHGIPEETRGAKNPKVQQKIDDPWNQRFFFGKEARRRREGLLYHDGVALWFGDNTTKKITPIPLDQISSTLTHPDFPGVIIAYRREWSHRQNDGKHDTKVEWVFVDQFKDLELDHITVDAGKPEKVTKTKTAFDMHANSMEGWAFGVPDALAAWIWSKIATELYMDGVDVSSALATLAFKVSSNTKQGAQNASLQFANPQGAGGTAVMGAGTDLTAMNSAGRGYDFSTVREVISLVASALDVSNIALTSNPGDAGSSYGSAATLDLPTQLAMEARRTEHISFDTRILTWMGAPDAEPYFEPLVDGAEQYRRLQTVTLPWLQGVISDDMYKQLAAGVLGIPDLGVTPAGMLYPNNKASLPRKDIDADGSGGSASTAAPTQGRSSGNGDGANARDTRDDGIG